MCIPNNYKAQKSHFLNNSANFPLFESFFKRIIHRKKYCVAMEWRRPRLRRADLR